jgi:hypothetical protein
MTTKQQQKQQEKQRQNNGEITTKTMTKIIKKPTIMYSNSKVPVLSRFGRVEG